MKSILIALFLVVGLAGCGDSYSIVQESGDPFHPNLTTYHAWIVDGANSSFSVFNSSAFNVRLWYTKDAEGGLFSVETEYFGDDWIFADRLDILVDGHTYTLRDDGEPSRTVYSPMGGGAAVREDNLFPLPESVCNRLGTANAIAFRLLGTQGSLDEYLDAKEVKRIHGFVALKAGENQ